MALRDCTGQVSAARHPRRDWHVPGILVGQHRGPHGILAPVGGECLVAQRFMHWLRFPPPLVWLAILATVFAIEYGLMLLLPWVLPGTPSLFVEASVDAIALTAILAPVLWTAVVRPLREVIRLRTRFLTDLFAQIEADRKRAAYELHDGIGQTLSLLISGLRTAQEAVSDAEQSRRFQELVKLAQGSLQDVRRIALGLRPSMLDDLGLGPALERLAADVQGHHSLPVKLETAELSGERLPEAVEIAVFRIVQEALANVVAHARATVAVVKLHRRDGLVRIEVCDDGCGFVVPGDGAGGPGHLGLLSMRERAELLGGKLHIVSGPGLGTRIHAVIPVEGRGHG